MQFEHTTNLRALFERLDYYGLTIKPSKCTFGVDSLKFLGFQVSSEGISSLPDRVYAIQKFSRPNTLTQLRRFLGMYNFYRRFIPKAAHILAPLITFLEGHTNKKKPSRPSKNLQTPLEWTEEAENSFTAAKTALADATLLKHPIPGATLSVWTDASNFTIGSSLMQLSNSNWESIAFLSLYIKLSKTQQNWSTYDRELLAIYTSNKKFRHMLEGREFIIYTDQKPLTYAFKQKPDKCTPRQLRHLDYISQFSTDIRYVVGTENKVADALSRVEIDAIIKPPILDYKNTFALPDARFAHIHIDYIGPYPPSKGYKYCLTIIDRYTRWPEVIPTEDMLAETTARALLNGWISRFGTPVTITTDQGTNFESSLMRELTNMMGSHRIHSASYHPQSNGMIERFHRHLKSAIIAHENAGWTDILPIVLLGLRSAMKNDLKATSSQLVYGTTLCLPSDLIYLQNLFKRL
ncbi:retrovirus-related Pol polyprotein from transposon opus [Trichonephila clavipes]|nr:retrovirus-related Pol polyprotein from transposon opus [Trichonephila clavipes]